MNKIITTLGLTIFCTLVFGQTSKAILKDNTLYFEKNAICKYKIDRLKDQKNEFTFFNLKDSVLFELRIKKMEYWKAGPFEEYYIFKAYDVPENIFLPVKSFYTIEEIAKLIETENLVADNDLNPVALNNLSKKYTLADYEKRKAEAVASVFNSDSMSLDSNTYIYFEPAFEGNSINVGKQYNIHYGKNKNIGYFIMKEIPILGQKDFRVSFHGSNKKEIAIVTFTHKKNYKASSIFSKRDKIYHRINSEFTKESLESLATYLLKKGYL